MTDSSKRRKQLVEEAIHRHLKPLGFRKQKFKWQRNTPELLQQFFLDKMSYGGNQYQPEIDMSVLRRLRSPSPRHFEFDVRWLQPRGFSEDQIRRHRAAFNFDDRATAIDMATAEAAVTANSPWWMREAIEFDTKQNVELTDEERELAISELFTTFVIPCFERFKTEAELVGAPTNGFDRFTPTLRSGLGAE